MGCVHSTSSNYLPKSNGQEEDNHSGGRATTRQLPPPPPPPPPPQQPQSPPAPPASSIYKAKFDYEMINDEDITFKKGDRLLVDLASQSCDWWIATNQRTGEKGYIPSNFVCKDDDSPKSQEWWFNVEHKEADRKLLAPGIALGTFLVRDSKDLTSYVLSVRDVNTVKHYRIRFLDNGGFYIQTKKPFSTLQELIDHHKRNADGLCTLLTTVCPRVRPVPHEKDLETSRRNIKTTQLLGKGHFGEVWEGKLYGVFEVAVKHLKPGTMSQTAFLEEAQALHKLRHPNLVELIAICTKQEPVLIVTELMENGSLQDYLRKDNGKTVTFKTIVDMAAQIAKGMAFLESKNFVHRDLRAANVLVNKSLSVKIADLGLAREIDEDEEIYTASDNAKFPIKWTAPEAIKYRSFSPKSDVWSFGILLYELITFGRIPYTGQSGREVIEAVEKGYRMPKPISPINYKPTFYDVMMDCWHHNPRTRPTFEYLHQLMDDFEVSTEMLYD